jgi:hypothetical protein
MQLGKDIFVNRNQPPGDIALRAHLMRLLGALLSAWLALAVPASAQFVTLGAQGCGGTSCAGGGGGSVTWTATDNPTPIAGTNNPQTFSGVNIGTPAANRYVVVCAGQDTNGPITSMTIGGVTATPISPNGLDGTGDGASLWYANVPSGTTASIQFNETAAFPSNVGIAVGVLTTSTPIPPSAAIEVANGFNPDPQTTTTGLTVPSGGMAVICGATRGPNASPTWNVGIQDLLATNGTAYQILLGHLASSGTPSISGYAFQDFSIAAAAWAP